MSLNTLTSEDGWPVVEDDCGNYWEKCSENCDLAVVRPGKVQCSGYCDALYGWPREDSLYMDWGER